MISPVPYYMTPKERRKNAIGRCVFNLAKFMIYVFLFWGACSVISILIKEDLNQVIIYVLALLVIYLITMRTDKNER